jgi:hypothetical protein
MLRAVSLLRSLECDLGLDIFQHSNTNNTSKDAGRLVMFSRYRFRLQGQIRLKQVMSLSLTAHQPRIGRQQATLIDISKRAQDRHMIV